MQIEQIAGVYAVRCEEKGLTFQLKDELPKPCWVMVDPGRFRQVLHNLLGNAVKFTEHGQVVLQVRSEADRLHIAVSDSGIGIAPDRLDSIFAPFSQADASMARRFGGTGHRKRAAAVFQARAISA